MAGTDTSEGQAVWQPGGAEEDSRLREDNRHLHLAYDEEEDMKKTWKQALLAVRILPCLLVSIKQESNLHEENLETSPTCRKDFTLLARYVRLFNKETLE